MNSVFRALGDATRRQMLRDLASGEGASLVPSGAPHDLGEQVRRLRGSIDDAPKGLKWKLRAKVGDRKKWYLQPEEVDHD